MNEVYDDVSELHEALERTYDELRDLRDELKATTDDRDAWAQAAAEMEDQRNKLTVQVRELEAANKLLKTSYGLIKRRNAELEELMEAYFEKM